MKHSRPLFAALLLTAACAGLSHASAAPTPPRGEVVYNQETSTIGGVPFLVKGIYAVGVEEMRKVASYGFNVVQNYGFSSWTDEQVADYLREAQSRKIKVLFNLGVNKLTPDEVEPVKRRVEKFKDHPALYAWYLADEPSLSKYKPADLKILYQWIKKTDPAHPVFSSNWELWNFKDACDVDMPQLYQGPPSRNFSGPLPKQQAFATKHGKPWLGIANSYEGFGSDGECLSPATLYEKKPDGSYKCGLSEEQIKDKVKAIQAKLKNPPFPLRKSFPATPTAVRGQAIDMIAHGSNGIFYWLYQTEDSLNERWGYYTIFAQPALCDAMKATLTELDALWPRICGPAQNATTWYDKNAKEVFCWFRREPKRMTLMLVNESTNTSSVSIPIPGLEKYPVLQAAVSGENRRVKIENGILKDQFTENQAHVYLIDPQ